jgi:hypothetical protein
MRVDDASQETFYDVPPVGFQASWTGRTETAIDQRDTDAHRQAGGEGFEERLREEFTMPRAGFSGPELKLRASKFVSIRIHKGEELWFAENDRLDIHATGDTPEEAVEEFEMLLLYFYQHYRDLDESRALKYAKELKTLFVTGFVESNS